MIDFRYHLVSIVAIFLALAVGIVLGTTLLQDPAIDLAKRTSDELTNTNNGLRADLDILRGREAGNDAFVTAQTPELVSGALVGQRVLLIESPGSSTAVREATQQVIVQSGAEVSVASPWPRSSSTPPARACSTAWSTSSSQPT